MVESQSIVDPVSPKETTPTGEHAEISDPERPIVECLPNSSDNQSPKGTTGNGHIVYFRRKAETELGKPSICGNQSDAVEGPHARKANDLAKMTQPNAQMKEPANCVSSSPSIQMVSALGLSTKHCVSSPSGKNNNISPLANITHVHISSASSLLQNSKRSNVKHWEERYCQLQNLLKMVDQSDHDDYVQMLRSLSSVELSRHALELEKRSNRLSLEEAREMQRVHLFDVLGKHPKNLTTSSVE